MEREGETTGIENKVAGSGLITLDPNEFHPRGTREGIDLADWLYQGLLLREKEFRARIAETDFSVYENTHVYIFCSSDAIIPQWAYMLLATKLQPYASTVLFGTRQALEAHLAHLALKNFDPSQYRGERVIIKGCSEEEISPQLFIAMSEKLLPEVKSLMFGEACSTVPVYKKKK